MKMDGSGSAVLKQQSNKFRNSITKIGKEV